VRGGDVPLCCYPAACRAGPAGDGTGL